MGIDALLSFLKPITQNTHISVFEKQTAVIDAMSWLYRGCYSCSYELNMGIATKDFLYFINKAILMLRRHNIKPILVFDGRRLLVKRKTEEHRKKTKSDNLQKAKEFLEKGDEKEARKYFSRCIKITKEMIYQTIDLLKQMKVDYILAPYEADAQMAYLIKNSYAHFAISEDSDLLAYGCHKIVLKLSLSGECQYINLLNYKSPASRTNIKDKQLKTFLSFDENTLIYACIMAGCDYLPSIKGIGIKKAVNYLAKTNGNIDGTVRRLQFEKTFMGRVPEDYAKTAKKIALVFKYQRIFDPSSNKFSTLNPLPSDFSPNDFLLIGEEFNDIGEFAYGKLDIKKLEKREIVEKDWNEIFKVHNSDRMKNFYKDNSGFKNNSENSDKKARNSLGKTNTEDFERDKYDYEEGGYNEEVNYSDDEINKQKKKIMLEEKIDDQIDYLFEICKEFSEELKGKNNENLQNEENEEIKENKEIPQTFDLEENQEEEENSPYLSLNNKENIKIITNDLPSNPFIDKKSTQKSEIFSTISKNKFMKSPSIEKTLIKSPRNPFLVGETNNKEEVLIMDSIKKLSTEKIETKTSIKKNVTFEKPAPVFKRKDSEQNIEASLKEERSRGRPSKSAKVIDNNAQTKIQNFFKKVKS